MKSANGYSAFLVIFLGVFVTSSYAFVFTSCDEQNAKVNMTLFLCVKRIKSILNQSARALIQSICRTTVCLFAAMAS